MGINKSWIDERARFLMAGKAKTAGGLTPNMEVFAVGLASGLSQAEAYRKAYPSSLKWPDKTVWSKASELAANGKVSGRVKELLEKACEENEITVVKVLKRYWDIATADPNELTQYRRENCRYCYGINHQYQWKDAAEFFEAEEQRNKEIDEAEEANSHKRGKSKHIQVPPPLENLGGYGFDPLLSPHAKCHKCNGEGETRVFFNDTRHLKGGARLLYAGVEIGKDGLKIKMHDQKAHLDKVAAYLNMDKKVLGGDKENPLMPTPAAVTRIVIVPAKETAIVEQRPMDDEQEEDEE